jgi:(2Fe-2S) ferredoxin
MLQGNEPIIGLAAPVENAEIFANSIVKLGLDRISRHIFICADQTKPICCSKADSIASWNYLKLRLKELGLDTPNAPQECVFRTKANCLRVCHNGPIVVVYPDRVWYHSATPEVIERILQEHIIGNQVVKEYAFLEG